MKQGQSGIQYNVEIFDIKIALILLHTFSEASVKRTIGVVLLTFFSLTSINSKVSIGVTKTKILNVEKVYLNKLRLK